MNEDFDSDKFFAEMETWRKQTELVETLLLSENDFQVARGISFVDMSTKILLIQLNLGTDEEPKRVTLAFEENAAETLIGELALNGHELWCDGNCEDHDDF